MESGASITISDAMKYLSLDVKIGPQKPTQPKSKSIKKEATGDESEGEEEPDPEPEPEPENELEEEESAEDDPGLPKVSLSSN